MLRNSLRSCVDWRSECLPIGTASNEASKLYDSALTQLCGLYDDPNYGGLIKTISDMTKADPDFILGQCLALGLELLGISKDVSPETQQKLNNLVDSAEKNKNCLSEREIKHVKALESFASGDIKGCFGFWEQILSEYPNDMHAINLSHGLYFDFGKQLEMRDSIARIIPHWTGKSYPMEGFVHGMYAFGLEETNFFGRAQSEAQLALDMSPFDGWATHAISHIYETKGLTETGIKFLNETRDKWEKSSFLRCHNYWHLALHHIEQQEFDLAIDIFDNQIINRAQLKKSPGSINDSSSLLYRLELTAPECQLITAERWQRVYELTEPHIKNKYILGFHDSHCLMACLGSKNVESAEEIIKKLGEYDSNEIWLKTTLEVLEAMVDYNRENYSKAVDRLMSVRYDIISMGGSNAQRDVFNILLLKSALKSDNSWHKRLANNLINEKLTFKTIVNN